MGREKSLELDISKGRWTTGGGGEVQDRSKPDQGTRALILAESIETVTDHPTDEIDFGENIE